MQINGDFEGFPVNNGAVFGLGLYNDPCSSHQFSKRNLYFMMYVSFGLCNRHFFK